MCQRRGLSQQGDSSMQRTVREGISVQELGAPDPESKVWAVRDNVRRESIRVEIRRVNDSLPRGRVTRQVVRFSKREHSPRLSDEIWVSTLAHYREGEGLEADQRDPMEGRVKLDATPFVARRLSEGGVLDTARSLWANAEYDLATDPWVYCTAFHPGSERDAYRLGKRISSSNDTITNVLDVNAFALELGIDFAIKLNAAIHTKPLSGWHLIQGAIASSDGFEKVVYVDHGPVAYEDISGTLDTGREPVDLASTRRLHQAEVVFVSVGVPIRAADHRRAGQEDSSHPSFRCSAGVYLDSVNHRTGSGIPVLTLTLCPY